MDYRLILYIVFTFVAAFGLSGINYNAIIKKDKTIEARTLVVVLSLALGYLLTNFAIDFLNLTRIV